MTPREPVFPANRHALYEEHGYSAAIRSGDLLFVSGQVGSRADGTPEPDFEAQVRLAFENLRATLAAAGCTFDDLVDVTTFHTDPERQFPAIMAGKPAARSRGALPARGRVPRQYPLPLRCRRRGGQRTSWDRGYQLS
ncbi:RidA family protein [Cronobacter malonaticus]|uniref:RidA family protein n=1 Tax=Cronobacter malonaticus TaxID=413503 RepID=UPI0021AB3386|nr:RidA family protein [Cronobacter malonaticus]